MPGKKPPPKNVLALIAEALKRKSEAKKRQVRKPRRPWGLPPKGGS